MEKKPVENNKVMLVQSNALTEGRYQYDLIEKRIIYIIINEVRKQYIDTNSGQRDIFEDLVIQMPSEVLRKCDPNIKRVYESATKLRKKDIEINNEKVWISIGFITYAKHDKKNDIMEFCVSKQILPHLVELTEQFTTYKLAVAITLKSTYTQRMYELCSKWKSQGYFFIGMDKLRTMLKCEDKFKGFGEFRRGVLEIAQKELDELYEQGMCDLRYEWNIIDKDGKKVNTLEFKVKTKENEAKIIYTMNDLLAYIRSVLKNYFKSDYVDRVISACSKQYETAQKVAEKLAKKITEYPVGEMPAILKYVLKEDFGIV